MRLTKQTEIPGKIMKLRNILDDLENSELCHEHPNVDVRVMAEDSIEDIRECINEFNLIFNNSL